MVAPLLKNGVTFQFTFCVSSEHYKSFYVKWDDIISVVLIMNSEEDEIGMTRSRGEEVDEYSSHNRLVKGLLLKEFDDDRSEHFRVNRVGLTFERLAAGAGWEHGSSLATFGRLVVIHACGVQPEGASLSLLDLGQPLG